MPLRITSGDWRVETYSSIDGDIRHHIYARDGSGLTITTVANVEDQSERSDAVEIIGTAEDNAKLIAAAPELFKALEALVEDIVGPFYDDTEPQPMVSWNAPVTNAMEILTQLQTSPEEDSQ